MEKAKTTHWSRLAFSARVSIVHATSKCLASLCGITISSGQDGSHDLAAGGNSAPQRSSCAASPCRDLCICSFLSPSLLQMQGTQTLDCTRVPHSMRFIHPRGRRSTNLSLAKELTSGNTDSRRACGRVGSRCESGATRLETMPGMKVTFFHSALALTANAPFPCSRSPDPYLLRLNSDLTARALNPAPVFVQAVQLQLKNSEKVEKGDSSPVTVADYGAQALVAWSLKRSFPDRPLSMIGEEDATDLR
jgi:hypothetical protein